MVDFTKCVLDYGKISYAWSTYGTSNRSGFLKDLKLQWKYWFSVCDGEFEAFTDAATGGVLKKTCS